LFDVGEVQQAGLGASPKFDEQIHVAFGPIRAGENRAEQRQPPDVEAPAQRRQPIAIGEQ
jgi:hypothetical protein